MIVLIYLSGWFAGSETAITNITISEIVDMRQKKDKNIEYVLKSKRNLDRTLVSILIANNIINVILSSVAAVAANELFQAIGVTIMIVLVTVLIIVFGEIIPKSNAIWDTKKVVRNNSKAIYYLTRALNPLITFFIGISRGISRLTGKRTRKENLLITEENIKNIATLGEEEGVLKKIERDIIHNVFIFGDRKIEEIMVPMAKVFYLEKNYAMPEAKKLVIQRGFTRIPVVNKNKEVVGVLYSKDLIAKEKDSINSLIRLPFIIDAKSEITDIFNAMKQKRIHLAIVKDVKGNHIGIVTLEDILEELVGEIHDEYFDVKYKKVTEKTTNNSVKSKNISAN
jgi:CBS domain containing-hemolysin-like protein